MHITFIYPSVEKKENKKYIHSWQMEPLTIAQLKSLIPPYIDVAFYDDRIENIPYDIETDAVLMNIETYTANRAYSISKKFMKRNIPVIMGGYHASLMPEETLKFSNAIVIGEAEGIMQSLIDDIKRKELKRIYGPKKCYINNIQPDRSIFKGKKYTPVSLVETSRGCPYYCDFCSISAFHKQKYKVRPIDSVIEDIKQCKNKNIFFVDDNLIANIDRAKQLFKKLIPLKIHWACQGSIHLAKDKELLKLMKKSGCTIILIGFESLNKENLKKMKKQWNVKIGDYTELIKNIHREGIGIYATFVFGYGDDEKTFQETYNFAMRNRFLFAAFNHLVPFPGTDLYKRLKRENKLIYEQWWRDPNYKYGDIAFYPEGLSPENLKNICIKYRKKYFSLFSILYRASNYKANLQDLYFLPIYFGQSFLARKEIDMKTALSIGENIL